MQAPDKREPSTRQNRRFEERFERFLWGSRFLVMAAVIPSLLGAFLLFIIGTLDICEIVIDAAAYYFLGQGVDIHETVVPNIVIAVDIYLVAIVLLVFGLGVYRLFVSPIEQAEDYAPKHPFNVESFDQLKDKIARVVILAVIIEFFRAVVDIRFQTPLDAIYLAVSVLALAGAIYLMSLSHQK
ncbi:MULTISPECIES: YqhA family protein [unclassified Modicisalibacter]|uniref:YqhA family protein n=1 Tax=unclassified Modicisalibacter TaxID=2679913 RepID=UPI001CCBE3CF|nr:MULTISPECIES: YqhA family protein [unclassified Modicisalibacter]MBZ9559504.1 YqhA family protein [Modicisalibacter sp. R2A 31.J]MBZ9576956.1 YqhA family protein [Modicisalibacter sp. MOD 31.J]